MSSNHVNSNITHKCEYSGQTDNSVGTHEWKPHVSHMWHIIHSYHWNRSKDSKWSSIKMLTIKQCKWSFSIIIKELAKHNNKSTQKGKHVS